MSRGRLAGYLARGFEALGHTVTIQDDSSLVPSQRLSRLVSEYRGLPKTQHNLVAMAWALMPDLVLIVKGAYVWGSTVRKLRQEVLAPVVNWMPDDPYAGLRPRVPAPRLNVYDCIVTYSPVVEKRLRAELRIPVRCIPFGFDPDDYFGNPLASPTYDVAFLGQHSRYRERLINLILDWGYSLLLRGSGWDKADRRVREVWLDRPTFGRDACLTYHMARVGLNVLHPRNNRDSHNMRTFEILGSQVAMVTQETSQQVRLLENISGVYYYRDDETLQRAIEEACSNPGRRPRSGDVKAHRYQVRCKDLIASL